MKRSTVQNKSKSNFVNMGPIRLRQPLPSLQINDVDPFILLHHYGPYQINAESNPFDLGPHPHRGFEPITLLVQGEQLHRDSLGNHSVVKAGDVQWTTAGKGIVHAEGPTKDFVNKGGALEGIQLWLNLPSSHKMMEPAYQHIRHEEMPVINSDASEIKIKVVAGSYKGAKGKIKTQTPVNVLWGVSKASGSASIDIAEGHQALVYLIKGKLRINDSEVLEDDGTKMIVFNNDGYHFLLQSEEDSVFLVLTGTPLEEKVVSYGPFVMNSQQEIQQALVDYQQGKMGFVKE
jgi:redox-sensitive bicupin YhaK (pirin superfamily)